MKLANSPTRFHEEPLLIGRKKKTSNNQFNLTIPVVMVCAGRFARHKPRQALRAGIAG
jgi:hypothetical protein